jgi:hypothetical protein
MSATPLPALIQRFFIGRLQTQLGASRHSIAGTREAALGKDTHRRDGFTAALVMGHPDVTRTHLLLALVRRLRAHPPLAATTRWARSHSAKSRTARPDATPAATDCNPVAAGIARTQGGRDGTGRHIGLKIRGPHGRGGSSPPARTITYIFS